jgi:Zn ribbon nucleic-acid-binding protein
VARPSVRSAAVTGGSGHLACPFCNSYDVSRLYVASIAMDSCECLSCGARWDEDAKSGEYKGRANRSSVFLPRGNG